MNRRRPQPGIKLNPVPVQEFLDRSNLTQKDMAGLVGISEASGRDQEFDGRSCRSRFRRSTR